jgi:phosphohistidine phosphatase SixA
VPVYLVRHAKAGSRSSWSGPDEARPLNKAGIAQARAVTKWLSKRPVPRVLSSPFVRCVQTVESLAAVLDVKVEQVEALSEGTSFEAALDLLDEVPEHTVLCSHGDVILAAVDALVRRGLAVKGQPVWRKGATWVLNRDKDGRWTSGRVVLPPT